MKPTQPTDQLLHTRAPLKLKCAPPLMTFLAASETTIERETRFETLVLHLCQPMPPQVRPAHSRPALLECRHRGQQQTSSALLPRQRLHEQTRRLPGARENTRRGLITAGMVIIGGLCHARGERGARAGPPVDAPLPRTVFRFQTVRPETDNGARGGQSNQPLSYIRQTGFGQIASRLTPNPE